MVTNSTGKENHDQILVSCELYLESATTLLFLIIYIVVSAEQYAEKSPSSDLRFPDKNDLVNYTKTEDIAEIVIPQSLVEEKLNNVKDTSEYKILIVSYYIACKAILLLIVTASFILTLLLYL